MRLDGLQNAVAYRHGGCLLAASGAALPTGCWRSACPASSPPLLGRLRFSTESRQNAFGDFQLIELVAQFCPFAIEPREPLGNPLLLPPSLVQCRHLLFPFSCPQYRHDTLRRYSPTNRGLTHDAAKKTLKQSGPQRSSRQARLPYIRPPQIIGFQASNSMLRAGPTTPQDYPERSGFAPRRERECGHRRHCAGANRRLHPCASTSLAMTEITLCREPPAAVNEGEIVVASNEELHAAQLSGKRLLALWNALPDVEKRKKVGDRDALVDELWSAIETLPEPQSDAKRPSKQDAVIAMLRRPEGATVDEVASATGWQRHTVRGVFSGALKKKLGLTLASAKEERGRVYRIGAPANP